MDGQTPSAEVGDIVSVKGGSKVDSKEKWTVVQSFSKHTSYNRKRPPSQGTTQMGFCAQNCRVAGKSCSSLPFCYEYEQLDPDKNTTTTMCAAISSVTAPP